MAKKKNTKVRFLGGYAARKNLLGILSYPVGYDGTDKEHTRFFMVTPEKWLHRPFDASIVSAVFENSANGKCWWLLDKRGMVHSIRPEGLTQQQIEDAGTGPGKYGYLSSIQLINEKLYACGYCRQVYEYTADGWKHIDDNILLAEDAMGYSLNDIAGYGDVLCAVGNNGEIAIRSKNEWKLLASPTTEHLYALCSDGQGSFYAAGANGTIVKGNVSGFELLCSGDISDALWDIEYYQNNIVVSATSGLYLLQDGKLVPFNKPVAPAHVGYKLTVTEDMLISIGSHQIFSLENNTWKELICPDNA